MNDPRSKTDPTVKVRLVLTIDSIPMDRLMFSSSLVFGILFFFHFALGIEQVCHLYHEKICGNGGSQPENLCGTAFLEDRP